MQALQDDVMHVALSDEGVSQAGLRRMISNQSYWTCDNVATKKIGLLRQFSPVASGHRHR